MLDNTISPSWSIDGVAAAAARELTKNEQNAGSSKYVLTTYLDGTVSKGTRLTVAVKKPRATASSNGVKRGFITVGDDADITNPQGLTVGVQTLFKLESSIPVGLSSAEYKGLKALLIAIINHAIFDKIMVNQEV